MWRKRNKCLFRLLSLLLPCALLCSGCGTWGKNTAEEMEEHTRGVFAMGAYMMLTAYGEGAEDALAVSEERIRELEALWSVTDNLLPLQHGALSAEITAFPGGRNWKSPCSP